MTPASLRAYLDRLRDYAQFAHWGRGPLTRARVKPNRPAADYVPVPG